MPHTFPSAKPAHFISTVHCAASSSPVLPCAGVKMQKSACFHDALGYHWCPEHAERGKLLNWAKEHGYPHIAFVLSDGSRRELGYPDVKQVVSERWWIVAILTGGDEVMEAAARYVAITASQDDEPML